MIPLLFTPYPAAAEAPSGGGPVGHRVSRRLMRVVAERKPDDDEWLMIWDDDAL
jgi:hypothetical protein